MLEEILEHDEQVLRDPAPTVGVLALGESSMDFESLGKIPEELLEAGDEVRI